MILPEVCKLQAIRDDVADPVTAQKVQREYKAKISSQSKKNFVLEKDVRYLDSRIALLIQNRMALEEVGSTFDLLLICLTQSYSKMKLQIISKMPRIFKKDSFPMMKRHRNTATFCSFCSQNLDT